MTKSFIILAYIGCFWDIVRTDCGELVPPVEDDGDGEDEHDDGVGGGEGELVPPVGDEGGGEDDHDDGVVDYVTR